MNEPKDIQSVDVSSIGGQREQVFIGAPTPHQKKKKKKSLYPAGHLQSTWRMKRHWRESLSCRPTSPFFIFFLVSSLVKNLFLEICQTGALVSCAFDMTLFYDCRTSENLQRSHFPLCRMDLLSLSCLFVCICERESCLSPVGHHGAAGCSLHLSRVFLSLSLSLSISLLWVLLDFLCEMRPEARESSLAQ